MTGQNSMTKSGPREVNHLNKKKVGWMRSRPRNLHRRWAGVFDVRLAMSNAVKLKKRQRRVEQQKQWKLPDCSCAKKEAAAKVVAVGGGTTSKPYCSSEGQEEEEEGDNKTSAEKSVDHRIKSLFGKKEWGARELKEWTDIMCTKTVYVPCDCGKAPKVTLDIEDINYADRIVGKYEDEFDTPTEKDELLHAIDEAILAIRTGAY